MPTTHHSAGAERHMQAEHAHDAAAASKTQSTNLTAHEETRREQEREREAQQHARQAKK